VTAHAGEEAVMIGDTHSVTDAINSHAFRIDHGVALLESEDVINTMKTIQTSTDLV